MAETTTKAVGYIRIGSATSTYDTRGSRISSQLICGYCELHRIELAATLIDKGMVTQGEHGERRSALDEALGMLREGHASLLIVPSMSHLALSIEKLARLIDADGQRAVCAQSSVNLGSLGRRGGR